MVETVEPMLERWCEHSQNGTMLVVDRQIVQCEHVVVAKALFGADFLEQAYRLVGAVMDALDYLIYQTRTLMMIPDFWPDPETFHPDRFAGEAERLRFAFIPFGGRHHFSDGQP